MGAAAIVVEHGDASVCLTDPGFDVDVTVRSLRVGPDAAVAIIGDSRVAVPLGEAAAVGTDDQRQVPPRGRGGPGSASRRSLIRVEPVDEGPSSRLEP